MKINVYRCNPTVAFNFPGAWKSVSSNCPNGSLSSPTMDVFGNCAVAVGLSSTKIWGRSCTTKHGYFCQKLKKGKH